MKDKILKLIKKYKKEMKESVIMDDYDGGRAATLTMVINDLEKLLER